MDTIAKCAYFLAVILFLAFLSIPLHVHAYEKDTWMEPGKYAVYHANIYDSSGGYVSCSIKWEIVYVDVDYFKVRLTTHCEDEEPISEEYKVYYDSGSVCFPFWYPEKLLKGLPKERISTSIGSFMCYRQHVHESNDFEYDGHLWYECNAHILIKLRGKRTSPTGSEHIDIDIIETNVEVEEVEEFDISLLVIITVCIGVAVSAIITIVYVIRRKAEVPRGIYVMRKARVPRGIPTEYICPKCGAKLVYLPYEKCYFCPRCYTRYPTR